MARTVTHKDRERMCSRLLTARGWISCWLPIGSAGDDDYGDAMVEVRSGNLQNTLREIDGLLDQLGHLGGGSCGP